MLLPPLCTQAQYVAYAEEAGLRVFSEPLDISKDVAKTWSVGFPEKPTPGKLVHL